MIKKFAIISFTLTILTYTLLSQFLNTNVANSFLFVITLLCLNVFLISLTWIIKLNNVHKVFALLITLLKYPAFVFSIIFVSQQKWINSMGIVIGICEFLIIIVVTVLTRKK